MNNQIILSSLFSNVKDIDEFLKLLKKYQEKGTKRVLSYGFADIGIQELINIVEKYRNDVADLEEMCRIINFHIHS